MAAGTSLTFTYQAAIVSPLPDGTAIVNVAQIGDGIHIFFDKAATTTVDVPDLSTSTKQKVSQVCVFGGLCDIICTKR